MERWASRVKARRQARDSARAQAGHVGRGLWLGPSQVARSHPTFLVGKFGSPPKNRRRKEEYPCSNLSTGGGSFQGRRLFISPQGVVASPKRRLHPLFCVLCLPSKPETGLPWGKKARAHAKRLYEHAVLLRAGVPAS